MDSIDLEVFLVKSGGFKNSLEQCFTMFLKKIMLSMNENVMFKVLGLSNRKV